MKPGELIKRQPLESRGDITIGNGVWLGFGVIVLDGVTISDGAVVGAGAVVTADIPENAIAVGSPARVVGTRGDDVEEGVKSFGTR
jgi:acetyltransferase-like isoleucine patch superfamily enzyme